MDNTVSINTNVTVDSYEVIDDLNIVDEAVQVNIVDALFTSTQPDWNVDDPDSPYYIKNKPTKTSDFTNDGSNGTSRYVEESELTDLNRVNDVQVKTVGSYASVVVDKIAKIDLSNYVIKEYKTGSESAYKVLSDNNYTDGDKAKVNYIITNGDGSQALTNNGTYKELYNILNVNGVTPDSQKAITITPENMLYNNSTLKSFLDKTVTFNSSADKSITLDNNKFLFGKNTTNNAIQLLGVNSSNSIILGDSSVLLNVLTSSRPTVNTSNQIAYLSDITNEIATHNNSQTAHNDIRQEIANVESHMVIRMTNSEMAQVVIDDSLENGAIVTPEDNGTYTSGKLYKYNNQAFILLSNYQVENLYRASAPTNATVGVAGQLCFDTVNLKIWRCTNSTAPYNWTDITPSGSSESTILQEVINNTRLISDATGGFTAGNNYRLLDQDGIIPVERIPQVILQGMTYGGSFDGNGIITASTQAQAIDGQVIDTVNKAYYKNFYFAATANYTLDGVNYIPGNFALSSGTDWVKIANSGQVVSVNGYDGIVVLDYTDVGAIGADKLVTSWSITPSDSNVPSEKLVKDSLDGKQPTIDSNNMLSSDLVDDTNNNHKFVTASEKSQITTNQNDISTINGKLMAGTTSENPAANVDFVNSSIATNTANFIGTFTSVKLLENVGHLVIYSILKEGSVIAKGSIVNGTTYDNDTTLNSDLNITANSTLAFGSLIKSGSTIEIGSIINHETYESQTTTSDNITIDTITNNDYANVINQELDFATTTAMNAYDKTLLTNYDYGWVENGAKYDLYRFDIETQTWGLRATNISKGDVSLITAYNRYKYNATSQEWMWDYTINTSGFTAAQWAAINSGATAEQIAKIGTASLTTTATDLSGAVNELNSNKQPIIDSSHKLNADLIENGSTNKVYTATDKSKVDIITTTGDGNSYLANDGTYKQVQSAPEIDNSSITLNAQDKLQTVGVLNTGSNTVMKQWNGTQAEYDQIQTKDPDTYYFITDSTSLKGLWTGTQAEYDLISPKNPDIFYLITDASATSGIIAGNGIDITGDTISNTAVLTGNTAPTTATVGYVGQFYLDTATQKLYKCDAIVSGTPDTYTWNEVVNIVTSLSSLSTDSQVPSAKCVYDLVGDIDTILQNLNNGGGV